MFKKLLIIWAVIVLVTVGVAWAIQSTTATVMLRITDSIGRQYSAVSCSYKNQYGFGGVGDTLTSDSTVSRGTIMNIHRIKEAPDIDISTLLPIAIANRTQLDSSYMYTKWSSMVWGLNNYYSSVGGLNGWQTSKADSGRFTPKFAAVARANGIYLSVKTVYPPAMNFGSGVLSGDSTFTYSDSANIDSSLYGAVRTGVFSSALTSDTFYVVGTGVASAKTCSLVIYGANQNLIHGRMWRVLADSASGGKRPAPVVAGDSIYSIDSVKARAFSAATMTGTFLFKFTNERPDSL